MMQAVGMEMEAAMEAAMAEGSGSRDPPSENPPWARRLSDG